MPVVLVLECIDSVGFSNSFHEGASSDVTFDIGLMRLLSTAIIELEYAFVTIDAAAV